MRQAAVSLQRARDLLIAAEGNSLAASVLFILHESADGITHELGAAIRLAGAAPDAPEDVRYFVSLLMDRLHRRSVTVPPDDPPPSSEDHSC